MTAAVATPIHYPSGDGKPIAETFDHLHAMFVTIEVLRLYLQHEQACILGNQFLYYEEGSPTKRCAPDVMVIFGLGLRLEVAGKLISFYRLDNGTKLLTPSELYEREEELEEQLITERSQAKAQLMAERSQAEDQIDALQQQLDRYRKRLGEL